MWKKKGMNRERHGNFRYARMWKLKRNEELERKVQEKTQEFMMHVYCIWELKKRKVEIDRKVQGKTWGFLIHVYMGPEKEKGRKRKE